MEVKWLKRLKMRRRPTTRQEVGGVMGSGLEVILAAMGPAGAKARGQNKKSNA